MSQNRQKPKTSRKRTDREKVDLFLRLAEELRQMVEDMSNSDPAHNGFGYNCKFSMTSGAFSTEFNQPSEKDLRSFLITLRKLTMKKGDANIRNIHKIFYQRVKRDELRQDIGEANSDWLRQMSVGSLNLTIGGSEVRPEYAVEVWNNGKYFHDDLDYAEELERIKLNPIDSTLHRIQFLNAITSITNYAFWLANNITYSLKGGLLELEGSTPQRVDTSR